MRVETGFMGRTIAEIKEAAQHVEALGFDGLITPETGHDPFFPLLIAAEHTQRITLGTSVAIAFPRSPFVTAQIAWDLQHFSGGRFQLGLGTQVKGHNERRYSTPWVGPPGPRLREYILCLRAIFDTFQNNTPPRFQGKYYQFTLINPFFNPGPIEHPHVPIYISAVGPYMCRLAGELCDGVRLHGFNTLKYTREVVLPNLEAGAKKAGRSVRDIDIVGGGFIITGRNREELERLKQATRNQVAFYGSTRTYHGVLEAHGWGEIGMRLHQLSLEGKWQEMASLITDDILREFAIIGAPDEIAPQIKERWGGIVTTVSLAFPGRMGLDDEVVRTLVRSIHEI
ncbi:MAG: TIGR03617 family F420-dependent LLM class oxidoreductase [Dehalococcoidia bacterium]|jgi:probable F420-dependent oxidoreductase|nr:TIGR03617 family F420-dependent LLM class oxidoreductase [Dehalococcoidia bacterium]